MNFFLSCETPSTARCSAVDSFLFKIPLNDTLHDFKGFRFFSISVSFCDLGVELCTQDLVKFVRRSLSQDIFFKMAESTLAPALKDVRLFTVL